MTEQPYWWHAQEWQAARGEQEAGRYSNDRPTRAELAREDPDE